MTSNAILAIRPSTTDDSLDVVRLAALDSAPIPSGALLLGVVDGVTLAAVSTTTGAVVADPFAHTAELVELLRRRALRVSEAPAPVASRVAHLRHGLSRMRPRAVA